MERAPIAISPAAAQETTDVVEKFSVEEFFDFINVDDGDLLFSDNIADANEFKSFVGDSSSSVTLLFDDCSNSSLEDFELSNLTRELCVPYDDPSELEWVSTFPEESFSSEDMEKLQFISGMSTRPEDIFTATNDRRPDPNSNSTKPQPEPQVPGKARSKRARPTSGNWTSPLLTAPATESEPDMSSNLVKKPKTVRKCGQDYLAADGRKCQHCETDKTPQWRTGPNGPKTLCNACGVRYKTGRLLPEYRPASSPTFAQTKHSNSHRKVLELRRQKGVMGTHQQNQRYLEQFCNTWMDGFIGEDCLIHRRSEFVPDFGQLI